MARDGKGEGVRPRGGGRGEEAEEGTATRRERGQTRSAQFAVIFGGRATDGYANSANKMGRALMELSA